LSNKNKILNGDCIEILNSMDDSIIDLTITSPPYDNLRSYKGFNFDFENIANQLLELLKQEVS